MAACAACTFILMVRCKRPPVRVAPKYESVYSKVICVGVDAESASAMRSLLKNWNQTVFHTFGGDVEHWKTTMAVKQGECADTGLFVQSGVVPKGTAIAIIKGYIVVTAKGSKAELPPTHFDMDVKTGCVISGKEFDCYIAGIGTREPFNASLCNHACENQNCVCVEIVTQVGALSLPWVALVATEDIRAGSECLVDYGPGMLSDVEREGYVPCKCAACAKGRGKFIVA